MGFDDLSSQDQDKIINAACEVFGKHGYKKASMRDIALAAGVSKSVLFKYFSTKENLYGLVFRLASEAIAKADNQAKAQMSKDSSFFDLMRSSAAQRFVLFKDHPWFYQFSYTAAFDTDPIPQALVGQELARVVAEHCDQNGIPSYPGVRTDLEPHEIQQLLRWVSWGFLETALRRNELDLHHLTAGFGRWIDILEKLLASEKPETNADERR